MRVVERERRAPGGGERPQIETDLGWSRVSIFRQAPLVGMIVRPRRGALGLWPQPAPGRGGHGRSYLARRRRRRCRASRSPTAAGDRGCRRAPRVEYAAAPDVGRSDGAEAAALDAFRFSAALLQAAPRAGEPQDTTRRVPILDGPVIDVPLVLPGCCTTRSRTPARRSTGRHGGEVAWLVNAVTKLDRLEFRQAILNGNGNGLGGGGGGKSAPRRPSPTRRRRSTATSRRRRAVGRAEARRESASRVGVGGVRVLVIARRPAAQHAHAQVRRVGGEPPAQGARDAADLRAARRPHRDAPPREGVAGARLRGAAARAGADDPLAGAHGKSDVLATIERELNQAMARQGIAATLEVSARARRAATPPLPARRPRLSPPRPPAAQVREVAPYRVWLRRRQLTHWCPTSATSSTSSSPRLEARVLPRPRGRAAAAPPAARARPRSPSPTLPLSLLRLQVHETWRPRQLQGLHLDAEAERVPAVAHHRPRPEGADRRLPPHAADGRGAGGRRRVLARAGAAAARRRRD